ncbi:MAG: NYN domain-containing protein [Treponema sp.]|jgi:cold shock CspA family protein/uncharacterized LabA/DUF88 family protein|nr:NYN domain-containing protein [Treponema sp.]
MANTIAKDVKEKNLLDIVRIGIFYDGYYFYKISNYYKYEHEKKARISISGLHEYIRNEVATLMSMDIRQCQIIDAHYFKGRSSARELGEKVQSERVFEDILMRENIVSHYLPLRYTENNVAQEKGIDVWLALEAYELAIYKHFDILVLVAGDGDYLPLVRKLHTVGTQVMLVSWDFTFHNENGDLVETRTSRALWDEVFYPLAMHQRIEENAGDYVKQLFVPDKSERAPLGAWLDDKAGGGGAWGQGRDYDDNAGGRGRYRDDRGYRPPRDVVEEPVRGGGTQEFVSTICNINANGFGFIRDDERNNIFFHWSNVTNMDWDDLQTGMRVSYEIEQDPHRSDRDEAPRWRATTVTVLD